MNITPTQASRCDKVRGQTAEAPFLPSDVGAVVPRHLPLCTYLLEKGTNIVGYQLWFFHGNEVPTPWQFHPPPDVRCHPLNIRSWSTFNGLRGRQHDPHRYPQTPI